jgi:hypothetical protein
LQTGWGSASISDADGEKAMKVSEERLIVVEASRAELFDLFGNLTAKVQAKYFARFREMICADTVTPKVVFTVEDWSEIGGDQSS